MDLTPEALEKFLLDLGEPRFRARQLLRALYKRRVASLDEVTDLPASLRRRLADEHDIPHLDVVDRQVSEDGTTKYLFELHDGARIESVAMPRPTGRTTYCLSTQVGCRMACTFCATGRMGIVRQLEPSEIVAQVTTLWRLHPEPTSPNLVFMGMGEPLDNLEGVLPALRLLTHPEALGISTRRINVSTSGLVEGIRRLRDEAPPVGLAISLTSADPRTRARLMPVAGRTPLEELMAVAREYARHTRRRVTLECAIVEGENDTEAEARRLLDLARRGRFKVNLIPLNPIDEFEGRRPQRDRLDRMVDVLWQGGVVATVRDSQGREIDGACGQLVHRQQSRPGRRPRGRAR